MILRKYLIFETSCLIKARKIQMPITNYLRTNLIVPYNITWKSDKTV